VFYWKTIGNTLHTNASKHLYVHTWSPRCTSCATYQEDTLYHRYGMTTPPCSLGVTYNRALADTYHSLCDKRLWPDQDIYIPSEIMAAPTSDLDDQPDELRNLWRTDDTIREHTGNTQLALSRLSPRIWVIRLQYQRMGVYERSERALLIEQLTWELNRRTAGTLYTYILPRRIFRMALRCNPRLALQGITSVQ
jgi:hypothetical protein